MIMSYEDAALAVWRSLRSLGNEGGAQSSLALLGCSRLAKITKSEALLAEAKSLAEPLPGGSAVAFMALRGMLPPDAAGRLSRAASEELERLHAEGGDVSSREAFELCPFLLWTGLAAKRQDFIDASASLADSSLAALRAASKGCLLERGTALASLAEMAYDLPKEHPGYPGLSDAWRELAGLSLEDGSLEFASDAERFPGAFLALYSLGRGLKNGGLDAACFKEPFLRGVKAGSGVLLAAGPHGPPALFAKAGDSSAGSALLLFGQAEQLRRVGKVPPLAEL